MEITVAREKFLAGLSKVQNVADKRQTQPILSNVLLEAGDSWLNIAATDLEVGIRGRCEAEVADPGSVTVAAKKLFEIVRELPEDEVHLKTTEGDWLAITCGKVDYKIMGLSAEEFPTIPTFEGEQFANVPANTLMEMIERTIFAVSTDETRQYLTGIFVEAVEKGSVLRMAATDGHRLSLVERKVPDLEKIGLTEGVIVPRKGMSELRRLLTDTEQEIEVGIRDRHLVIRKDDMVMMIRLIDGEFPNYEKVIPKGNDKKVLVSREMLYHSLKRIALLAQEMTRGVKFSIGESTMVLSSNNPNLGEAREEIEVGYDGSEMEIGFNARYLLDMLSVLDSEEVRLELDNELSPGIIIPTDEEGFLSVIMPMRL